MKAGKLKPQSQRKVPKAPGRTALSERQQEIERSLRGIQKAMSQVLFRPLTRADGMQPVLPDGKRTEEAIARFIKPNDRLTAFERLEIYNQQYWWRLIGVFQEDFHGLRAVLGVRKFDRLAVEYLQEHGSTTWSLRDLGQHLVSFLQARPDLTAPKTLLALDMARVEWAKVIAFDGPALPLLDPQRVAQTPPDRLTLNVQPHITLLQLTYPIDHMLKRLREKGGSSARASNAVSGVESAAPRPIAAKPNPEPLYLAVHRKEFSVYYKRLAPVAYRLLSALRDGTNLADACGLAFSVSRMTEQAAAESIRTWFQTWMELGWLTK